MSITAAQVTDYLDRYCATLTAFDAEGAAALWSIPGMIADDHFSGVLESRDLMVQGLAQSYPVYRRLGFGSVTYSLGDVQHLSAGLVLVRVHWRFLDPSGADLTDSTSYYLLRLEDQGLRACLCVETNSAQKLQALAFERGVDLMPPTT